MLCLCRVQYKKFELVFILLPFTLYSASPVSLYIGSMYSVLLEKTVVVRFLTRFHLNCFLHLFPSDCVTA